jgi:hypothetical protein
LWQYYWLVAEYAMDENNTTMARVVDWISYLFDADKY